MSLDSKHLRAFLAVADNLHFGQAAESLDLAQSALSVHIKRLEDVLGGPLFRRGRRSAVTLTAAGRTFYTEALATIAQLERSERIGRLATQGEAGTFRVGYVFSAAMSGILSSLVTLVRTGFPEMAVSVTPMETPEQIAAVADARIDIGLVRPRQSYPQGVQSQLVHREHLLVALSDEHPLACSAEVSPADLSAETFLIPQMAEANGFAAAVDRLVGKTVSRRHSVQEAGDFVSAASLAASGHGIILAPQSLSHLRMPGLTFRPIASFEAVVDLALVWRGSGSPVVAALRHALPDLPIVRT